MSSKIVPVIMCGGAGTRLANAVPGDHAAVVEAQLFERPIVSTSTRYRVLVVDQLRAIDVDAEVVLEPERRDSAPAVAAATIMGMRRRATACARIGSCDQVR